MSLLWGARDVTNRGPRESCDRYEYPGRAGRCRRPDVEGALIGGSDVHEVAERVVSLVLGTAEPFHRIGPDVNDRSVSHGYQPVLRRACREIHP